MKKFLCILLALLTMTVPALAEDANPFAPYVLTAPEGAELTDGEGSLQGLRVIWKLYEAEDKGEIADLRGLGLDEYKD